MAKIKELQRFYANSKWKRVRDAYYISKKGICERCNVVCMSGKYQVHHKIELTLSNYTNPNIAYGVENLELLCLECHNKEHDRFVKKEERVKFDANGEIIF